MNGILTDGSLGRARTYSAHITGPTPDIVLESLRWTNIAWQRTLSGASTASVDCPARQLIDADGRQLDAWSNGLAIYRNDGRVWWGPIRMAQVAAGQDVCKVQAVDALGLTAKRLYDRDAEFIDVDVAMLVATLLDAAGDLRGLETPEWGTGITVSRVYQKADYQTIEDMLNEFGNLARWTVVNHELVAVGVDGVTNGLPTVYGMFTDSAFVERPGFDIVGDERANEIVIPGGGSGEAGFRLAWRATGAAGDEGRLTRVVSAQLYHPVEGLQFDWDEFYGAMANRMLDTWSNSPVVIHTTGLTPSAPIDIETMIPGTAWQIAIAKGGFPALNTQQILESVDVNVNATDEGITEEVVPTLIPLSTFELQL